MPNSASNPRTLPSDRALDDAVRVLAGQGRNVPVVQIVDVWAAQGSPSQAARLLAGRAFLALRMMDRAASRAREVLEQEPGNIEALKLLGEVYLTRGWPAKARAPLAQARGLAGEGDVELEALWEQAHVEPARPDSGARRIEREGTPEQQIELAEAFLASGSFLRATGILERLRRAEPGNTRVEELLWGLSGDSSLGDVSLGDYLRELLPVAPIPSVGAVDEPEFTESYSEATAGKIVDVPPAVDEAAFPTLFKHGATPLPDDDATGERTAASMLASAEDLADPPLGDVTDGGSELGGGHGDTQIMLVLRPGEEVKSTAHRRRSPRDGLRETLNLREYQASMGMSGPASDPYASDLDVDPDDEAERSEALALDTRAPDELEPDPDDILEEEDESLVVMTRVEDAPAAPSEDAVSLARPIEVIEKHPLPPPVAPPPTWPDPVTASDGPWPAPPPPSNRWLILALAVGALVMLAAFGVIVGSRLWSASSGSAARTELLEALAPADYDRLLQAESVLDAQLRANPSPAVAAALAEARLVLWSDFNGDPARMEYVQSVLADARDIDVHRLALLRAATAYAREDYAGANAAISRQAPEDDEERLLFARLAARSDDPSRALEEFTRMSRPDAPRYALARADVLASLARPEDALAVVRQVLRSDPDHVLGNLAQARITPGKAEARVANAQLFLNRARGGSLPPRVEGAAHALRARGYMEIEYYGKAREAADAGLARDGGNPDLLLVVADAEAQSGDLVGALGELDTIVASRPGNAAAQAARVLLLLDLDRVDAAEAVVAELRTATLLPELTPVLQGLVTVWGRNEPPVNPPGAKAAGSPLGAWLAALVAAQARTPDAAAAVDLAVERLLASSQPFERRLVPRARALRLLVSAAPDAAGRVADVEPRVVSDPVAHVLLGRYYESIGRRPLAAQHFDRAAELGPQVGLAWYEKGRFYLDARDSQGRSSEAWRSYLKLGPSGPRSDRVTSALRR